MAIPDHKAAGVIATTVPDDALLAPNAAALAVALERAAAAVARLDMALADHLLAAAWAYRARLDAVRRQAAANGQAIDPWSSPRYSKACCCASIPPRG